MPSVTTLSSGKRADEIDMDDDEGWEEMPVIRNDDPKLELDEEDQKKYHYVAPKPAAEPSGVVGNATGNLIDFDVHGNEWRSSRI
jgi:hypothetical protein